jgi:hypothetical protein
MLKIETYLLSQTTLEQIFISFARKQNPENELVVEQVATALPEALATSSSTRPAYLNKGYSVTEESTFSL